MSEISEQKKLLRNKSLAKRRSFSASQSLSEKREISLKIAQNLFDEFKFVERAIVASFLPLSDEVDVSPIDTLLKEIGIQVAYPRIEEDQYLSFRIPDQIDQVEIGSFGVRQPPAHLHKVYPEVFLVPLVAFDPNCYRLGYGHGHYDRALSEVSADKLAIGIAYEMQKVDKIPREVFDQQLDYVVTEKQIYKAS